MFSWRADRILSRCPTTAHGDRPFRVNPDLNLNKVLKLGRAGSHADKAALPQRHAQRPPLGGASPLGAAVLAAQEDYSKTGAFLSFSPSTTSSVTQLCFLRSPSVGGSPQGLSGFSINLKRSKSKDRHNYNLKNNLKILS